MPARLIYGLSRTDRLLDSSDTVDAFPDFPRKAFAAVHAPLRIVRIFLAFALRDIADFGGIEKGSLMILMFS
jgi:hypothetical protein